MTARYEIVIDARVAKSLQRIPASTTKRIIDAIASLAEDPFPHGAKKLRGRVGWRIRIGDYRILYDVDGGALRIWVFKAGHRSQICE